MRIEVKDQKEQEEKGEIVENTIRREAIDCRKKRE